VGQNDTFPACATGTGAFFPLPLWSRRYDSRPVLQILHNEYLRSMILAASIILPVVYWPVATAPCPTEPNAS